jgi:preprotein translocase subunit SecE
MSATTAPAGFLSRTKIFVSQVRTEMKKVTWPSREEAKTYTQVVLAASVVICIVMAIWDKALSESMRFVFFHMG